ncbi:hypothetical protein M0802_016572 [Mischocyttarus mexicanus]|nr:hypothetical protein M0802_016572 [Mischocyttarus mexicanus]
MRIFYVRFLFLISGCTGISRSETREYEKTRNFLREKRHLLFPDPMESETKVQVLFGLGLPMEEDISMTLGYVLKCNYDLPYNSSDFTRAHARFKKFTDNVLPQGEKPEHRGKKKREREIKREGERERSTEHQKNERKRESERWVGWE